MSKKILIVEDEKAISDILVFNLERKGYETIVADDGREGLRLALESAPDLILLDVMLPGMDGFEICKNVRKESEVPIIMLTAREEEADKIFGLELGADDYITKPFSMPELMARIRANTRRSHVEEPAETETVGPVLKIGELEVDLDRHTTKVGGNMVDLTVREFELLVYLMQSPGKTFSREDLMKNVWNYDYYGDLRAVDVCVRRLREKVEPSPAEPKYIRTRRGLGYYVSEEE